LENMYPVMFLDALMVKMRHEGRVENRAVYVAIGVDEEGRKDVLGLWSSANEGAKFWLGVMTELRNRGLRDPARCLHPLHGRPQRFSRCHWARVSQGAGADLHRAHDPRELELCGLERAQGAGCGPEADRSGGDYRISRACTDSVSRAMAEAPGGGGCVAAQLGARHSVFPAPEANRSARRSRSSLSARWR